MTAASSFGSGDAVAWNVFTIVDGEDDDAALYPVLSEPGAPFPFDLEPLDGPTPVHMQPKRVRVLRRNNKEFRLDQHGRAGSGLTETIPLPTGLEFELVVTDSRLVMYCEKFDKGGGWVGLGIGGVAVAVAANAVSKARAASRRKGKMLVGQVRYSWINTIRATPKVDLRTSDYVLISMNASPSAENRFIMLELIMPKGMSALDFAHHLAQRTARYRLTHNPQMPPEERDAFAELSQTLPRQPATPSSFKNNTWVEYAMPTVYRVNPATAYPRIADGQ